MPMKTKSKSRESRSENAKFPTGVEERIRQRAYELYLQRGRVDGFALDDWLSAEREIVGTRKQLKVKAAKKSKC
jgi:Protein of unknown function (DUF2934)